MHVPTSPIMAHILADPSLGRQFSHAMTSTPDSPDRVFVIDGRRFRMVKSSDTPREERQMSNREKIREQAARIQALESELLSLEIRTGGSRCDRLDYRWKTAQLETERLKRILTGLGTGASASLSDGEFEGEQPHPDHLRLADWVMGVTMEATETDKTYEEILDAMAEDER